ncbi:hypothetical protein BDR06DRAFT_975570 [Suillus hirtellus]|nr:hypothetical protein BDR06DRAFT_975570 [Suillus hirtellus]
MLDILYTEKLCIHDWPAGVPPPGPDFDLKALSASQLHALVAPYLRLHLGAMYEAELGLDDDNNDSEAEAAKAKKCKGKSKKSGDKGRKQGAMVEEPSVILHISRWPESDILTVETQATSMCLIPLVIDTNSKVVRSLQDSEKFIKELLQDDTQDNDQDDTPRCRTKQEALCPNQAASRSNQEASCSNHEALRSCRNTNQAIKDNFPPLLPPQEAPHLCHPTNQVFEELLPSLPPTPSSQFSSPPPISYTHKWTWPIYESAQETEDLECEMVEERHHVRAHDNSRVPLGHAQSQAHHHNHSTVRPSHVHPASPDRCAIMEEDEYEYY